MLIGYYIGIVVFILSFAISLIIIKKFVKAKTKFKRIILSVLIMVLITSVMTFFTVYIENFICKFDTAESAFHFNHSEEIIDTVEGHSSCMVIYKKNNNTIGIYYLYKSDTAYKIPNIISSKRVKNIVNSNITFNVVKVIGTNDYYIDGLTSSNENIDYISNDKNGHINKFAFEINVNNKKTFFIYDYIGNYETDNYYLIINDEKFSVIK